MLWRPGQRSVGQIPLIGAAAPPSLPWGRQHDVHYIAAKPLRVTGPHNSSAPGGYS